LVLQYNIYGIFLGFTLSALFCKISLDFDFSY